MVDERHERLGRPPLHQPPCQQVAANSADRPQRGIPVALLTPGRNLMSAKPAVIDAPRMRQTLATIDAMFYLALSIMAIGVCVGVALH